MQTNLNQTRIFYMDRGDGLTNKAIDDILEAFEIECFLSMKRYTYNNALVEATYKVIKTEF